MGSQKSLLLLFLFMSVSSIANGKEPPLDNKYEDGITLTITSKPFNPRLHNIAECKKEPSLCMFDKAGQPGQIVLAPCAKNICAIDGKPAYGAFGKIPKQQVASLLFEQNGRKVALNVSNMYNPYVNNSNIKKYVQVIPGPDNSPDNPDNFYRVVGYFSLGDGGRDGHDRMYIGLWTVWHDGSFRNYLGDFGSLHDLAERAARDFNYKSLGTIMRENSNKRE